MIEWRLYYDDRSTYSNLDGPVEDARGLGLLAIKVADPWLGHIHVWRFDYYWFDSGRWWGGDIFGLWDYLQRPGFKKVGFGRSITNEEWNDVIKWVLEDHDFAPKSGWSDDESRP